MSTNAPFATQVCSARDTSADEVALAVTPRQIWVAWSRATLEDEHVVLAASDGPGNPLAEPELELPGFRPSLASLGERVLLGVCSPRRHVTALIASEQQAGTQRWDIPAEGAVHRVAVSPGAGDALGWLAWDELTASGMRLLAASLDASGSWRIRLVLAEEGSWFRSPALASDGSRIWLACVEGRERAPGAIAVRAIGPDSVLRVPIPHAGSVAQDAPAIAIGPGTMPIVAWHSRVAPDGVEPVLRWPSAALIDPDTLTVSWASPPFQEPPQTAAGEDQGWEMPALASTRDGAIWLGGRSSNGFWIARRSPEGAWSERACISSGAWGGRGTRLGLAVRDGEVLAGRREPEGVEVSSLALPPPSDEQRPARTGPPAPRLRVVEDSGFPVLFGDLHWHSAHSDALGTAEDLWCDARDRGLDFGALTDHDRFCGRAIGPLTWKYMCQLADAFDDPGRFAALPAFEFTGPRHPGPGHKCVYFGYQRPERIPDKNVESLFEAVREHGGIAAPHHVGWTGSDADHHDPALQPVWEICSVHGSYEGERIETGLPPRADVVLPGQFVRDALDAGLRFGLVGGTDSHGLLWHHGISRKRNPFRTGLTAIVGAQPERASILHALRRRCVYATTGARILLDVRLGGEPMGSELPSETRDILTVRVRGESALRSAMVVSPDGERPLDGIDGALLDAAVTVGCPAHRAWTFYYLRVTQENGEIAWSSPIWIG